MPGGQAVHSSRDPARLAVPAPHGCGGTAGVGASVLSQHGKYVAPSDAGQHSPAIPCAAQRGCRAHAPGVVGANDGDSVGATVLQVAFARHSPLVQSRAPCPASHF